MASATASNPSAKCICIGPGVFQTLDTVVTVAVRRGGQQRIPRPPSFRAGAPPAWCALPVERRRFTLDEVRARLTELPPPVAAVALADGSRAAAVLVPLYEFDGETYVVLIKRPETMPSHQGEIAFPGG